VSLLALALLLQYGEDSSHLLLLLFLLLCGSCSRCHLTPDTSCHTYDRQTMAQKSTCGVCGL